MFVLIRFYTAYYTVNVQHFTSYSVFRNVMSILFLSNNVEIVLTGEGEVLWICALLIRSNIVLSSNNDVRCPMYSLIYSIMQLFFFQWVIKAFSIIPSLFSVFIL